MPPVECSDCKGLRENCDTCHGWAYHIRQQEQEELDKNIELAKVLFFPGCGSNEDKTKKEESPPVKEVSSPTTPFEGWTLTDFQRRVKALPVNMHGDKDAKVSREEAFSQLLLRVVGITGLLANTLTSPLLTFSPDILEVFITELLISSVMLTNTTESPMDIQKAVEERIAELKRV